MKQPAGSATGRRGRSRLGGVPVTLPATADAPVTLFSATDGLDRAGGTSEVLPGAVHVRGWLDVDSQRDLVHAFRRWAVPPAGLRHPRMPTGHLMSVQSVCLGWHWQPYGYSATADDTDGAP